MKKVINVLLVLITMFFCCLINVNALSVRIIPSKTRVNPGDEFKIQLLFSESTNGNLAGSATLSYDSNLFDYVSYGYNATNPVMAVTNQESVVNITYSYSELTSDKILHLYFKAKSDITSDQNGNFLLTLNADGQQGTANKEIMVALPSNNADLLSLTLNSGDLSPSFNPNTLSYTAIVDASSVKITATEADSNAKAEGDGTKKLSYGVNNFVIKVTAEDGTIKTYTIAVTRPDNRSDDSTLKNITLSDGVINFNSNTKNYNVDVTSSSVKLAATANNSNATVEYLNGSTISLGYGETKTAKIKVTSEKGTTSTYSITLTRKDTRSNDSTLKSISLSDGTINFNSNTKNYHVTVNASKVTLYATKNNEYATVTYPNGNSVNLEYGQTATLKVKVTAQTGATSIYTINLTRKDARSSDNTLKSLAVSNTNIKYNNKTTVYNAQVENNIESISISATANNSKARINGTGTKSLAVGNNSFIVKVTAENGDVQEYIIVINRKAKVTNKEDKTNKTDNNTPVKLSSDNYLKSLKIEEVALDFSKTITDYNVFVDYNITNINLSYEVSSSKAIVSMTGETNLQVGLNIIKLIVAAENGDVRTYTLNINRRPERNIVENTEIAIISAINSSDMDDIYIVAEQQSAPYNMSSSILNALSQTGKTIIYEIVDDGAVIYQLKLIGGEITNSSGFNFEVLFNTTKEQELKELANSALYLPVRFNYSGEIPGTLYLSIYNANEKIVSSDNLKLYEYEADKNKLNLIDSVIPYENVIELKIDDVDKEYVLIDNLKIANSLSDNEIDNKNNNNVLYTILLSFAIVLVIILIILVIKRFINKKKNSTTTNANLNDSDNIEMLDNDNL